MRFALAALLLSVGCTSFEQLEKRGNETTVAGSPSDEAAANEPTESPSGGRLGRRETPVDMLAKAGDANSPGCRVAGMPLPAAVVDEANNCLRPAFIGCASGSNSSAVCFKRREDGLMVQTVGGPSQYLLGPDWVPCSASDWAKMPTRQCSD